MTIKAADEFGS